MWGSYAGGYFRKDLDAVFVTFHCSKERIYNKCISPVKREATKNKLLREIWFVCGYDFGCRGVLETHNIDVMRC